MARFSPGLQNAINNLMTGHGTPLRMNPAGRSIQARRSGTCPISGEPISPGDSITKTDAGWVLSEHAGGAMENPLQIKRGKGKFKQTPQSVQGQLRHQNLLEDISQRELGATSTLWRAGRLSGSTSRSRIPFAFAVAAFPRAPSGRAKASSSKLPPASPIVRNTIICSARPDTMTTILR